MSLNDQALGIVGLPVDPGEIETFLRALRHGSSAMTDHEIESVWRTLVRNAPTLRASLVEKGEAAILEARLFEHLTDPSMEDVRALFKADASSLLGYYFLINELSPKIRASASRLASEGKAKGAADLLVGYSRVDLTDGAPLVFAVALYGTQGDLKSARAVGDLLPDNPTYLQLLAFSLVPGTVDPSVLLTRLPGLPIHEHLKQMSRALLEIRAGRPELAESAVRPLLDGNAPLGSGDRRLCHTLLALSLAHQGKAAEAVAELEAAEAILGGDVSDAALLKRGKRTPTTFVLLRREILGLIDR